MAWSAPERLIISDKQKFKTNYPVAKKIAAIKKKLVPVCICGPARNGKSTVMNKLVQYLTNNQLPIGDQGFGVSPNAERFTKGFWVWYIDHPTDPDKGILLVDVEGLDDMHAEAYDNCMLCLTILLSSVFIFNIKYVIARPVTEKLQFVEVCDHIRQQCSSPGDNDLLQDPFPALVFAVRDYNFKQAKGKTEEDILEDTLKAYSSISKSDKQERAPSAVGGAAKKNPRKKKLLTEYFNVRKLMFFHYPTEFSEDTNDTHNIPNDKLDPQFVKEVEDLGMFIINCGQAKTLRTTPMDGEVYITLLESYIQYMNENRSTTTFGHGINQTVQQLNLNAIKSAITIYKENMEQRMSLPVSIETLESYHLQCIDLAMQKFIHCVYFDSYEQCFRSLKLKLEEAYTECIAINIKLSYEVSTKLAESLSSPIFSAMQKEAELYVGEDGFKKLQSDLKKIKREYDHLPDKGIMAEIAWNETVNKTISTYLRQQNAMIPGSLREEIEEGKQNRASFAQDQTKICEQLYNDTAVNRNMKETEAAERMLENLIPQRREKMLQRQIEGMQKEATRLHDEGRESECRELEEEIDVLTQMKNSIRRTYYQVILPKLRTVWEEVRPLLEVTLRAIVETTIRALLLRR